MGEVTQDINVAEVVGLAGGEAVVGGVRLRELQPGLVEAPALHTEPGLLTASTASVGRDLVGPHPHSHHGHQHQQRHHRPVPHHHPQGSGLWPGLDSVEFGEQENLFGKYSCKAFKLVI